MRRILLLVTVLLGLITSSFAQSDYYIKKAQSYQREAEYYQKKAEGYRREASYLSQKGRGLSTGSCVLYKTRRYRSRKNSDSLC